MRFGSVCSGIEAASVAWAQTSDLKAIITVGDRDAEAFTIDINAASEALKCLIGFDVDLRIEDNR